MFVCRREACCAEVLSAVNRTSIPGQVRGGLWRRVTLAAQSPTPRRALTMLLATAALLGTGGGAARAGDEGRQAALVAQPSNEELIKKLLAMEQRVQALEKQLKQKQSTSAAPMPKPVASAPEAKPPNGSATPATPVDKMQMDIAKWAASAPVSPPAVTPSFSNAIWATMGFSVAFRA